MAMMSIAAIIAVALPFAVAAAADRFVNHQAEPDERLRSFVIYMVGGIVGLLVVSDVWESTRLLDSSRTTDGVRRGRRRGLSEATGWVLSHAIRIGTANRRR